MAGKRVVIGELAGTFEGFFLLVHRERGGPRLRMNRILFCEEFCLSFCPGFEKVFKFNFLYINSKSFGTQLPGKFEMCLQNCFAILLVCRINFLL